MLKIEDLFSVQGKIAVVTGGHRGIGEMIASTYLANGVKVYISSNKAEECDHKAKELSEKFDTACISIPADLATIEGIKSLVDQLSAKEEKIDILVNNAGATWGEPIDDYPEAGWDKVMDINIKGMFFMCQQLLPLLRKAGSSDEPARIINIGSIDGYNTPAFENYAYSISKAAVHHLTRVLGGRFVKEHILVNAIAPGVFQTNMMKSAIDNQFDKLIERIPNKRLGTPEDIGGIVLFLSSRAGNNTVGATITCDGGTIATTGHDFSV